VLPLNCPIVEPRRGISRAIEKTIFNVLFPVGRVVMGNKPSPLEMTGANEYFDFHSFRFGLPTLVMLIMV
jgi:hypothetical protein